MSCYEVLHDVLVGVTSDNHRLSKKASAVLMLTLQTFTITTKRKDFNTITP